MPNIRTKDGIVIKNVPESVMRNADVGKAMVQSLRSSSGAGTYEYNDVITSQQRQAPPQSIQDFSETPTPGPTSLAGQTTLREQERAGEIPTYMSPERYIASMQPKTTPTGMAEAVARGGGDIALGGLVGAPLGPVGSAAGMGVVYLQNTFVPMVNQLFGTNVGTPKEALNNLLTELGVGEPDTTSERILEAAASGAMGAQGFQALGQLAQSISQMGKTTGIRESGKQATAGALTQTMGEAGSEAAVQTAREMGADSLPVQIAAAVLGDLVGTGISAGSQKAIRNLVGDKRFPAIMDNLTDLYKRTKAGDIPQIDFLEEVKKIVQPEDVPETFTPRTRKLVEEQKGIIEGIERFGETPSAMEVELAQQVPTTQKRAAQIGSRLNVKGGPVEQFYTRARERNEVLFDTADEFGINIKEVLPSDLEYADTLLKDFAKKRGDTVRNFANQKLDVIDLVDKKAALRAKKAGNPNLAYVDTSKTVQYLRDQAEEMSGKEGVSNLGQSLNNFASEMENVTLKELEDIRTRLGEFISGDVAKDVPTIASRIKKEAYNSLKDDMGRYIGEAGGRNAFNKWKVADRNLKGLIEDFSDQSIKQVIDEAYTGARQQTPEDVSRMLFSQDESTVKKLYRDLTPEGRSVARQAVIVDTLREATEGAKLSPRAFANKVTERGKQLGVMFTKEQTDYLEGVKKYFDLTDPAETIVRSPARPGTTSMEVTAAGSLSPARSLDLPVRKGINFTSGKYAQWAEDPKRRELMLRLARAPKGSPVAIGIVKRLREMDSALSPDVRRERSTPEGER